MKITQFIVLITILTSTQIFSTDISIDISKKAEISPYIYGMNQHASNDIHIKSMRYGGNRTTGYNWEKNTSNAGSDWKQSSDYYMVNAANIPNSMKDQAGICLTTFLDSTKSRNAYGLVTLPMAGYVAKDGDGAVAENETAPSSRWDEVKAFKNSSLSLTPDLSDNYIYVDEEVNFLANKFGTSNPASGLKGFSLDNEPALWSGTHPRIHPDTLKCSELISKSIETSKAVKSISKDFEIFGPALYGWSAFNGLESGDDWSAVNADKKYDWFIDYYLDEMKKASDNSGYRLLDVLDIHWYPETNEDLNFRPSFSDKTGSDYQNYRMNCPRSLYDSTYTEGTWISHWMTRGPINLIQRLQNSVDKFYPGTKIAITEYNYGNGTDISNAIAIADFLGAAAMKNLYFTSHWGSLSGYIGSAFKLYTNYDNQGASFGKYYIKNSLSDYNNIVFHSSINDNGQIHIIAASRDIDKDQNITVTLPQTDQYINYYAWNITSNDTIIRFLEKMDINNNTLNFTLKKGNLYHIVINNSKTTSSLNQQKKNNISINAYPNPFNPAVNININTNKKGNLTIFNVNGQKILEKSLNTSTNFVWNAQNYSSGIYFVKFAVDQKRILTKKLILMK